MADSIGDFIVAGIAQRVYDNFGALLLFVVVLMLGLIFGLGLSLKDRRDAFMEQCQEDHKEYECTAMWRAGSRSSSTVVPMPIIIR